MTSTTKRNSKQECIPVGCVLAAHWPYARVCFRGGVCSGGCLLRGVCLLPGAVYPWGVCLLLGGLLPGGVSAPGGCLLPGGVCAPRGSAPEWGVSALGGMSAPRGSALGGRVSQHALRQTPPLWTEWQTGVKNITLATTSLRPVKILIVNSFTVNIWMNYSKDGNDKRVTLFVEETFYLLSVLIWIL